MPVTKKFDFLVLRRTCRCSRSTNHKVQHFSICPGHLHVMSTAQMRRTRLFPPNVKELSDAQFMQHSGGRVGSDYAQDGARQPASVASEHNMSSKDIDRELKDIDRELKQIDREEHNLAERRRNQPRVAAKPVHGDGSGLQHARAIQLEEHVKTLEAGTAKEIERFVRRSDGGLLLALKKDNVWVTMRES